MSKPVHRVGLAAIGAIDVVDTAFGIGAAKKTLVIDFTAPCVRFDNGEFARAARTALRDEFSHTLILIEISEALRRVKFTAVGTRNALDGIPRARAVEKSSLVKFAIPFQRLDHAEFH